MKRAELRKIFNGVEGITDDMISQVLDLSHTETDALKDELDTVKKENASMKDANESDASKYKKLYEDTKAEFDGYKPAQTEKETKSAKESALASLLKDSNLSENGQKKALKYADLTSIELDDNGKIKSASKILKSMSEEWSDYVVEKEESGTDTSKDGVGSGGSSSKKMTIDEIYAIEDSKARQEAIRANPEAFQ